MTNEELVERVRKALYFAKHHGGDDAQAEVAIRGVARMLANNLQQVNRVFAPYEPPIEAMNATKAMGQQIVQLTIERGELRVAIEQLTRQLRDAQREIYDLQRRRVPETKPARPKTILRFPGVTHRRVLDCMSLGHISQSELQARTGMTKHTLGCRLSEMASDWHFGGALIKKHKGNDPWFELTEHGRALLNRPDYARYEGQEGDHHDAGRGDVVSTRPSLHQAG